MKTLSARHARRAGLAAILLLLPLVLQSLGHHWVRVADTSLLYVMLALGLNIVVGYAGLLDLGYVAFYAVGAYSYALLAHYFDFSFWLCLPLAGLLAATSGAINVRLNASEGKPEEAEGVATRPEPQLAHLASAVGLVWRSVVVWMLLLATSAADNSFALSGCCCSNRIFQCLYPEEVAITEYPVHPWQCGPASP